MSAVPEPRALLFSCLALALLLSFVSSKYFASNWLVCPSVLSPLFRFCSYFTRVQVQQRNGFFFLCSCGCEASSSETNWQFVEKGNGHRTQQQRNYDHRRCYGNGCWLFLVKDPQLKSGVSAGRFHFYDRSSAAWKTDVKTARFQSDPERRGVSL